MSGGTLRHVGKHWVITCEPHVLLRLKRVFERIAKTAHGEVQLSDTPENCRELEWFIARYPMEVDKPQYLSERAQEHRTREEEVTRTLDRSYVPPQFELAIPAREYQRRAADMLLRGRGLLLADDVGTGKTASAICTFTDPRTLPVLVVTLTHLPRQWEAEIQRFAPGLKVHVIKTGKAYDLGAKGRFPDVVVINYHKLQGWADVLAPRIKEVVYDEIQELRTGPGSNKYEAARHLSEHVTFRCGLSATPIFNYGAEIYNVLEILHPGVLGTSQEFIREWCGGNDLGKHTSIKDPKAFGVYLRTHGLMLRRTRAEVGRELPPLTKVVHTIDADLGEIEKIAGSAAELARVILAQKGMTVRGQKLRAAEEFSLLLRQATGLAKAPYVAEFVKLLASSGERVVLFGWHREVYSIWREKLEELNPVFYTGAESATEKDRSRQLFLDGAAKVLVMSLRAGAGLDGLQGSTNLTVFGELDWSPGVIEQCIGRVHRDGQPNAVTAYLLLSESGCDPIMADVLGLKARQMHGLRDPHASLIEALDTGGHNIQRLAAEFLRQRGLEVPG